MATDVIATGATAAHPVSTSPAVGSTARSMAVDPAATGLLPDRMPTGPHPTVSLSLVSHTNAGKTTLARTLLGRDIGIVRDARRVGLEALLERRRVDHHQRRCPRRDAWRALAGAVGTTPVFVNSAVVGAAGEVDALGPALRSPVNAAA